MKVQSVCHAVHTTDIYLLNMINGVFTTLDISDNSLLTMHLSATFDTNNHTLNEDQG